MARFQRPVINFNANDVWAAACAAQRMNGAYVKFVSPEDKPKETNREIMATLLSNIDLITDADRTSGEEVRNYYKGFTFKILQGIKLSDFDNTAMTIANRDEITSTYDIAVIASLPSCAERGLKRDEINRKINMASGGYVGTVGSKVTVELEILKCNFSQQYGVYFATGITNEDQAVFFAVKNQLEIGKTVKVFGTVKQFRENSTQLNRVKVI